VTGIDRGPAARPSAEEGISDLPDPRINSPPDHSPTRGGPPPNLYLYAAVAVLAFAVFLGLQDQQSPTPDASSRPSGGASPSHPSTALSTPRPATPPPLSRRSTPQHLQLSGQAGFFIGDAWLTVTLPPGSEGDYFVHRTLVVGGNTGGITITTDDLSSRCLTWPDAPPTSPSSGIPGLGSASGSAFTMAGYPGRYFEFEPPGSGGECHPNEVWDGIAPEVGGRGLNVRVQLWVLDTPASEYLVFGSYMATEDAPGAQETIRGILASVQIDSLDKGLGSGRLPIGPVEADWYWARADNATSTVFADFVPFDFLFHVPPGWMGSGDVESGTAWQLARGSPGEPGGAIVRVGRIDGVFADPCNHVRGPAVDPTATALADALARIPGVDVLQRSQVPVPYATAEYVAVRVPEEIGCQAPDFFLWWDDVEGARAATATGSTIRLWVFTPNDRSIFGRVAFEAETYADADPLLESEILQMLYSIQHGG
jgi:hypothetical protein